MPYYPTPHTHMLLLGKSCAMGCSLCDCVTATVRVRQSPDFPGQDESRCSSPISLCVFPRLHTTTPTTTTTTTPARTPHRWWREALLCK